MPGREEIGIVWRKFLLARLGAGPVGLLSGAPWPEGAGFDGVIEASDGSCVGRVC